MPGRVELAAKWSDAKDRAKRAVGGDADAKKAFAALIKSMNKDLGGNLGKVDAAVAADDGAKFDAAAAKAKKIAEDYRGKIDAAIKAGPLDAKMLQPMVFAIAAQKEGAIPDLLRSLSREVTRGPVLSAVFVKHDAKIDAGWLDKAVEARFKRDATYDAMKSGIMQLSHFVEGRGSFSDRELDKVKAALDRFNAAVMGQADAESTKTFAALRKMVVAQAGPVAAYVKKEAAKAEAKRKAVTSVEAKLRKELKDVGQAMAVIHQKTVAADGDSRDLVKAWEDAMTPQRKAPHVAAAGPMLVAARKLQAALDKLAGKVPDTAALGKIIDKTYPHGLGPPRDLAALPGEIDREIRTVEGRMKEFGILLRDTIARLERVG
jgi:hypothetical protein